jgi:hypothetical protein
MKSIKDPFHKPFFIRPRRQDSNLGSNPSQVRQKYQEDIFEVAKGEPKGPRATMARANPVSLPDPFS